MTQVWLVTGSSRGLGRAIVEAGLAAGNSGLATARDIESLSELSTAVMAGKPGTSGCGTGRFRRRACAPDRLIRPACYSEGEEPNQPGLAAIRRPAPRRPRLLSDRADGPEAQRIQALLTRGLQRESEFEKAWPAVLGTL